MGGIQTPYYYNGDGQLVAFVRVGNESIPASSMKIRELVLKGSGQTYDSLRSQYDFSEMAFTKLRSVYPKEQEIPLKKPIMNPLVLLTIKGI